MRTYCPLYLLGALGVLSAAGAAAAADTSAWTCETCPYPGKGTSGSVAVGVGAVSEASSKFGDTTGLQRQGAFLLLGGELGYRGEDNSFARLTASDLGLEVRSLAAEAGREGRYAVKLGYGEMPRHFSNGAMTPFQGSGGSNLALPAGFPAASTASMPLASSLAPVELGFKRSRLDASAAWLASENWTHRLSFRHDQRDGSKPTAGSFYASTSQLAAPVDQVTDEFELATAYTTRRWQASLAYQVSLFKNKVESLTWANPFWPVVPGAGSGQLAQAPDSQMHQIIGWAGYEITPTLRASAEVAAGRMTQDAGYLAPTLNPGLAATVPALPAQSLDGRVDTFNGNFRLVATPLPGLRLSAAYARDVRDNRTSVQRYPAVSTDMFLGAAPRSNTPFSFKQDRFKLGIDYRATGGMVFAGGLEQDNRERSYQEVVTTRETTAWGRIGLQARDDLALALKLTHADRDRTTYGSSTWFGYAENPLLRKYNLAARRRDIASLSADFSVAEKLTLGLTADYANDDYAQSAVGLTHSRSTSFGVDLSYALSEKTRIHLFAQSEAIRAKQAGSQTASQPDWNAQNKDRFDVLGVGVKHAAIGGKLDLGADLVLSRANSQVTVDTGVNTPLFPTVSTRLDSLKLYATYPLQDKLTLTGSWWYEHYSAQDWRYDGVMPATVYNLLAFGQQAPRYSVNVLRLALRYSF